MSIMLESMRPTSTKKAVFKGMRNALKKPLFYSFHSAMRNAWDQACKQGVKP